MIANTSEEGLRIANGREVLMNMNAAIEKYLKSEEYLSKFAFFKGREEIKYYDGREDEKQEIAKKMLKKNRTIEEIAEYTELSYEEIKRIEQELL